jgi:myo-inositol 2-dehydrogenase/D-chiro-inositol 1-dehydrogenase
VRHILDEGVLGDIVLIRENERRPVAQYSVLNLPVDVWQPDALTQGSWKDSARYSGGVARGHAIHEMDIFRWFAGAEARQVVAASKIVAPGREVPDAMTFQVEFTNGALAACDLYTHAPTGYPYYHQLEIIGTKGILRARDTDMQTLSVFTSAGAQFPCAYGSLLHIGDAYVNEQRAFFTAIMQDSPLPLDPLDARAALELSLAAAHAASLGKSVPLPFMAPSERSAHV